MADDAAGVHTINRAERYVSVAQRGGVQAPNSAVVPAHDHDMHTQHGTAAEGSPGAVCKQQAQPRTHQAGNQRPWTWC